MPEKDGHGRKLLHGRRYYARRLKYQDHWYYPVKPSLFVVGLDSWLDDERKLLVRRGPKRHQLEVSCPDDPQILFPPPETWERRTTAWERLLDA
jgi:hypothetical protein